MMRTVHNGWVADLADLATALSYFSIPVLMTFFAVQQELRLNFTDPAVIRYGKVLFLLFASFIALCGITHFIEFCRLWWPLSVVATTFKTLTAIVSISTALFLYKVIPRILVSLQEMELTKLQVVNLERVHRLTFKNSSHMISTHDPSTLLFTNVNGAVCSFGWEADIALTRTLYELVECEDRGAVQAAVGALKRAPDSTQIFSYRVWNPMEQRRHTVEASMFFAEGDVFILSTDVTDREERQAAERERDRVAEAIRVRTRYNSAIAHDLKTPLTTFRLALGLLRSTNITTEQIEVLEEAEASLEMMNVTVEQALDFARVTVNDQLQPRRFSQNIMKLVSKCEKIMSNYTKNVPVSFTVSPDVAPDVVTDGEWAWQMCINLLTNAAKYTTNGWIHLDITLVTAEQLPRLPCDDDISECADHRPHGRSNCGSFCSNRQLSTSDSQVLDEYTQPFEENRSLGLTGDGDTDKMAWECGKQELLGEQVRKATRNGEHFGPIGCAGEHDDSPCRGLTKGLFLRFAVTDTGVGVPDSLQPQLFRAFSQVQAMQNTGTGLGLYSVRQKAARLHGTCGMTNNPSPLGGSIFFFAIPYLPDRSDEDVNLIGTTEIDPPAFEQVQDWPATSRPLCPDSAPELAEPSAAVLGREGKKEAAGAKASGTGNSRPHRARHCETESNGPGHPCSVGLELPLYSVHKAQVGILVVDDTSTVRHLLAHAVKRMGYDVDTARTGEEALDLVEKISYKLVLCDLQMPVMTGPEFTRRWRARESVIWNGRRQVIIGMSANNDGPDVQACRDCGMDGFCAKPIALPVLKRMIMDQVHEMETVRVKTGVVLDGAGVLDLPHEEGQSLLTNEQNAIEEGRIEDVYPFRMY